MHWEDVEHLEGGPEKVTDETIDSFVVNNIFYEPLWETIRVRIQKELMKWYLVYFINWNF